MINVRPTGTLVPGFLIPENIFICSALVQVTAPFMSIIEILSFMKALKIILVHGTRWRSELAYQDEIEHQLPNNPYFGDEVREKLIYYPTVTRESYEKNGIAHEGRITKLIESGKLMDDITCLN